MTEKNIIKNWFRTGLKPTQEQFWAWIDSYFHKGEKIPQSQIENLDTTLANKADSSALDAKANADGSGLSAENIISWQEKLQIPKEISAKIPSFNDIIEGGSTYLKSPISFLKKDNAEEEGADAGALGIDPKTFTFHFGKFNSSSTGLWGFQFGYGALENNTTGAENTAVGHYALHKNTTGSYNVAFGLNAGYANVDGNLNTFLGYNAGRNIIKGNTLTLVGANAGASLNNDRFNLKDLTDITPIIGKLIEKDKNYYKIALGYDEDTQTIVSGLSSYFGAESSKAGPTRTVYSMVLGNNHLKGMNWRNYNNLIVSNGLIYKYSNVQVHNSLIWGNFMVIGNADNILAIHNAKTDAVEFSDALIYGKFDDRQLKINGRFLVNTQYIPTIQNIENQKIIVANSSGETSLVEIEKIKSEVKKSLNIGGSNLHKDTKIPHFTANSAGTGTKSVITEGNRQFARYTPDAGKSISLYGYRTEGAANGGFSRSIDVRHFHSENISIWGQEVPPNVWTRVKEENFRSSNDWMLLATGVNDVAIDLNFLKIEEGDKATSWDLHPEEAPNPFANTGLTESPLAGHILVMNPNTKEYFYKSLLKIIEQMDIPTLQLLKQRLSSV